MAGRSWSDDFHGRATTELRRTFSIWLPTRWPRASPARSRAPRRNACAARCRTSGPMRRRAPTSLKHEASCRSIGRCQRLMWAARASLEPRLASSRSIFGARGAARSFQRRRASSLRQSSYSTKHSDEQPSPSSRLPSSHMPGHSSFPDRAPSPHVAALPRQTSSTSSTRRSRASRDAR